jgi:hypothetical protein
MAFVLGVERRRLTDPTPKSPAMLQRSLRGSSLPSSGRTPTAARRAFFWEELAMEERRGQRVEGMKKEEGRK